MTDSIKPVRRVVTGNDAQGRSCVLYDSAAPNVNANAFKRGTAMTDVWVFDSCPAGAFSLNVLYDRAIAAGRLHGLVHDGDWMDVGTHDGLAAAEPLRQG